MIFLDFSYNSAINFVYRSILIYVYNFVLIPCLSVSVILYKGAISMLANLYNLVATKKSKARF